MSQLVSYDASGSTAQPSSLFGYEMIDLIGTGAGSKVYSVSDPVTSQLYVLKHVTVEKPKDERFVEQLEAEHTVASTLTHPGLRRSIELKINRTILRRTTDAALILELFDGHPIEFALPNLTPVITKIFLKAADALHALHKTGFVHCDLKPGNILLRSDGAVKIIDFGQACAIGTVKPRIQGTPDYISPEQVRCEACTPRTDIYNFGATMYWALTRRHMPTLFTLKRGENSILSDAALTPPHDLNPNVPVPLSNLVMECVRLNPMKRPDGMAEISRRLELALIAMSHGPSRPTSQVA